MISRLCSRIARIGPPAALTVLVAGSACVQDQELIIVERAIWAARDNCILDPSADSPALMVADVYFETEIGMGFAVSNLTSPNAGSNTGIDDSEIYIESAEVTLSFSGGGVSPSSYEVTLPSNSIIGGESEAFLVRVPLEAVQSMRATMAALPATSRETLEMEVVFRGRKANQIRGGTGKLGEVETRPYTFPFDICYGCLTDCNKCTDEGTLGTCPLPDKFDAPCGFAQAAGVYPAVYHPDCSSE